MRIKVTKKLEVQGGLPARDMLDHVPGKRQPNGFSIPLEYCVEGDADDLPTVGNPFIMHRRIRNGIEEEGKFSTSIVTNVTKNHFTTQNSVYNYEVISHQ